VKFAISYIGLTDTSKGYQLTKNISCLITMRTINWVVLNAKRKAFIILVSAWMIGMYPAFVKYPVSGSLFGSSSHVKKSVRLTSCSMSDLRYL